MKEKIREILENNGLNKSVELINDLISEPFEPGWYWNGKTSMMYLEKKKTHESFGFFPYFSKSSGFYSHNKIKATREEVLVMFLNEASRRGIVDGCALYHRDRDIAVNVKNGNGYVLSDDMLSFYLNDCLVFKNGEWAEVVKEESLDELYDEYRNSLYVQNILDFIKQNKEKFLIAINNL